jgi:FixJ family two-component response regulator
VTGHGDVPMAVSTMKKARWTSSKSRSTKPNCASWSSACSTRRAAKAPACSSSAAAERLGKLTAREHQVLERIIAGRLNKQIADDLGISIKTVEAHRANIMEKLNVNTVADLLRLALSNKPQQAQ